MAQVVCAVVPGEVGYQIRHNFDVVMLTLLKDFAAKLFSSDPEPREIR